MARAGSGGRRIASLSAAAARRLATVVAIALIVCPMCPSILLATAVADAHTGARAVKAATPVAAPTVDTWEDPASGEELVLVALTALDPVQASVRPAPSAPVPLVDLSNFSRIGQVASATALPRPIALITLVAPPPLAAVRPETRTAPAPIAPDDAPPPPLRGPPASA